MDELIGSLRPEVEIDGQVDAAIARDLIRMDVCEENDGLRTLEIRLLAFGSEEGMQNEGLIYMDGEHFDFGSEVVVNTGGQGNSTNIFTGKISAIEIDYEEGQEPEVIIYAEDKLMDLRMTRRMATYEDVTDEDIASEIASQHGVSADVDASGPSYDVVQQWNMSDLAFLRERARLVQADVWCDSNTLYFKSRGSREGTQIDLIRGNHILSMQVSADLAHQRSAVRVSGYDANQREAIDEVANGDVIQAEASGGESGPDVLQRAFGERESFRVRDVPLNSEEAGEWARQEMLRRARGFVSVNAITRGNPEMNIGSRVNIQNIGAPFQGDGYYVTRVAHTYDLSQGYRTAFSAERSAIGVEG